MSGTARGRVLHEAQRILRARNRELAELEVLDCGKPIQEAEVVDVLSGADCIEYYAGLAGSIHGEHLELGGAFFRSAEHTSELKSLMRTSYAGFCLTKKTTTQIKSQYQP